MDYPGYRIGLKATFSRMRDKIQIDVGIGDVVTPTTHELHFFQYRGKPMFKGEIFLVVYPCETIFPKKLERVLSKADANCPMKDYHDLLLLAREPHMINLNNLQVSRKNPFSNRGTTLQLIDFKTDKLKPMHKLWVPYIKDLGQAAQKLQLPENIQDVIIELNKISKNVEI